MQQNEGQSIKGSARIPVGEMARDILDQIFPHLTKEQVAAIKAGQPVPPSPNWKGTPVTGEVLEATSQDVRVKALPAPPRYGAEYDPHDGQPSAVPPPQVDADLPLVTCILVFGVRERMKMARKAVQQFVDQTYPRKQLVIVNTTEQSVTTVPYYAIKERKVHTGEKLTLGMMRNIGLDLADGDWVRPCWDDDDYYHPFQLAYQMLFRKPGNAVLLQYQMRIDIEGSSGFMHYQAEGIPNTMLVPRDPMARFPAEADAGDATAFWMEHYGVKTVAVNNVDFPANGISLAAYHGHNVTPREQFLGRYATDEFRGRLDFGEREIEHLKAVVAQFGLETRSRPASEVASVKDWQEEVKSTEVKEEVPAEQPS